MAKKRSRILIGLVCEACGKQNYVTEKNKLNTPSPLKIKKYCFSCKKRTVHKETKSLD
jgi:large subunit ribosomal protein L33